jgi:hypothetical protein
LRELITKINTKTMNIQDKMQEIHHKYGVTEKANYEIQLFIEDLIIKDRAEQLTLTDVSERKLPHWARPLIAIVTMSLSTLFVIYRVFYVC